MMLLEMTWDNTEKGKALIMQLLEKSQQEVREGKTESFTNVLNDVKEKYSLK